ncbi:hypothetical protein GGR28_003082 [Lewinella aquimaris]|uniref:Uncharacterized protein n=1 Tax=Neolewinella aquimaris TaxID=1835722 RepID=A0A840EET3_9BACT|nr:hypothetical protein [Neolewinella aquimaris]MBB4080448.1 hypothetical protein [Neolewinella aquimaris]
MDGKIVEGDKTGRGRRNFVLPAVLVVPLFLPQMAAKLFIGTGVTLQITVAIKGKSNSPAL